MERTVVRLCARTPARIVRMTARPKGTASFINGHGRGGAWRWRPWESWSHSHSVRAGTPSKERGGGRRLVRRRGRVRDDARTGRARNTRAHLPRANLVEVRARARARVYINIYISYAA